MPNLTDQEVHEIAAEIQSVRDDLTSLSDPNLLEQRAALERRLFEAECRLGRSLPPVVLTLTV